MTDYSKGKIYKLFSKGTDKIYIGSTVLTLNKRKGKHRTDFKRFKSGNHHYVTSFDLYEFGEVFIELLENYPCNSLRELHLKEREYILNNSNCVNKMIPNILTPKEQKRQQNKKNYQKNKERLLQKVVCECGAEICLKSLTKHRKKPFHQAWLSSLDPQ